MKNHAVAPEMEIRAFDRDVTSCQAPPPFGIVVPRPGAAALCSRLGIVNFRAYQSFCFAGAFT